MKECVLVTGGAGYIGSHTAVELVEAGMDVVLADNLTNSDMQAVEGVRRITGREVPFERVDCCDRAALGGVFARHRFGSVIHFAASKAVGESVCEPMKYYCNNLLSLMNVVDLMREHGRRNIVFSSSCTVYGEPDSLPVTERAPRKPATSPYGNTKQISEDILRDAIAAYGDPAGDRPALFQPHRRPSVGSDRRTSARRAAKPRPLRHADSGRCEGVPERFRRRLSDSRRLQYPRLYRRGRSGARTRGGNPPDDRGAEQGRLRNLQHRHRPGRFCAGARAPVRAGQQLENKP